MACLPLGAIGRAGRGTVNWFNFFFWKKKSPDKTAPLKPNFAKKVWKFFILWEKKFQILRQKKGWMEFKSFLKNSKQNLPQKRWHRMNLSLFWLNFALDLQKKLSFFHIRKKKGIFGFEKNSKFLFCGERFHLQLSNSNAGTSKYQIQQLCSKKNIVLSHFVYFPAISISFSAYS